MCISRSVPTIAAEDPVACKPKHDAPSKLSKLQRRIIIGMRWTFGALFTANFMIFWMLPIGVQGQVWKLGLKHFMPTIFNVIDSNKLLRAFALKYIYSKEVYTDFFFQGLLAFVSTFCSVGLAFYWQLTYGSLPLWLIMGHYFAWVGFGGRTQGTAYTYAHKEGHHRGGGLYKAYIANSVGNLWENWIGLFYGNVPFNFSTSHIFLHHRLNAGKGDPFYMWDVKRNSVSDLMLYCHRIFVYMTGYSSLKVFKEMGETNKIMRDNYYMLRNGMITFWLIVPTLVIGGLVHCGCTLESSLAFYFFIFIEPLCCMSFFLALINVAFHGFIEFTEDGKHIPCINSAAIIDGDDNFFGEDDHMTHHYYASVNHRDLPDHHQTQHETWAKYHASVFTKLSIPEVSIFTMFGLWDKLAKDYYVDYSGTLSTEEIAKMLEERASRIEMTYEEYEFDFLPTLRQRAEALVAKGTCKTVEQAFKEIAHTNEAHVQKMK
mmetsp:Transcript_14432/g.35301  ORF Transcript_14432/g.35301 Transcript_14432/m.35301 type:complete len:488 (-) Transcript_14432:397-1860(-)